MSTLKTVFVAGVCFLAAASATAAEFSDMALGRAGQLLRLRVGDYGELFPGLMEFAAETPVLALELDAGGNDVTRLLVPGSRDLRVESDPVLLYEPTSEAAILLWRSSAAGRFYFNFATFKDQEGGHEWSAVYAVERADAPVAFSDDLKITATRNTFRVDLEEELTIEAERTVVHLAWREGGDVSSTHYTALIFVAGAYLGWNDCYDLGELLSQATAGSEGGNSPEITQELSRALSLEAGTDEDSVIVAFADADASRLAAIEIRALPLRLSLFGDLVREQIFASADLFDPEDPQSFVDKFKANIIPIGMYVDLHPAVVDYVSEEIGNWIGEEGATYGYGGFEDLGNDARQLAIYLTNSVSATTVPDPSTGEEILEIDLGDFLDALEGGAPAAELFDLQVRFNRPAPGVGAGTAAIFPSRNGDSLLVAWKPAGESRIYYVESSVPGAAWSDPRSLGLDQELSVEQAIQLLQRRIR